MKTQRLDEAFNALQKRLTVDCLRPACEMLVKKHGLRHAEAIMFVYSIYQIGTLDGGMGTAIIESDLYE